MTTPPEEYIHAKAAYEEAKCTLRDMVDLLHRVARELEEVQDTPFDLWCDDAKPIPDKPTPWTEIAERDWPTFRDIETSVNEAKTARARVHAAWDAIPEELRVSFREPEEE